MIEINEKKIATWQAFLQTHNVVLCKLAREMQELQDLPLTWYDVLTNLNDDPRGGLRLQDLAQAIVLSQSGLTRLLDRMEKAGLVERKPCPYDRRGTYAIITPEGKTVLKRAAPVHLQRIEAHFMQYLDDDEVEALHNIFLKILAAETEQCKKK